DDRGRFEFTGVAAGDYRLNAKANGYIAIDGKVNIPGGLGKMLHLDEGSQIERADIQLALPGSIEGVVRDENGKPLRGVTVQIAQQFSVAGLSRLLPSNNKGSGSTNDRGEFKFSDLNPGTYFVLALSGPFVAANGPIGTAPTDAPTGFAPTFYPGTERADAAI